MDEVETDGSATVPKLDSMRLRYHRGDVVAKLMNETDPVTSIDRLAEMANVSRGTVSGLLNGTKKTDDSNVEAMARALGYSRDQIDEEVKRLNEGTAPVEQHRPRSARTRAEDYNDVLEESVRLGHKIATLPTAARSAITTLVMAFADAYREK